MGAHLARLHVNTSQIVAILDGLPLSEPQNWAGVRVRVLSVLACECVCVHVLMCVCVHVLMCVCVWGCVLMCMWMADVYVDVCGDVWMCI